MKQITERSTAQLVIPSVRKVPPVSELAQLFGRPEKLRGQWPSLQVAVI